MMAKRNFKIYFDLDNTLYSHEKAFEKSMLQGFNQLMEGWLQEGISIPIISAEEWFQTFKHYCDAYWEEYENQELKRKEYQRLRYYKSMQYFGMPMRAAEAEWLQTYYVEHMHEFVEPFSGLYELLSFLQGHVVEMGIITNGKKEVQERKWEKLRLGTYMDKAKLYISDEIGLSKPDPSIFQYISGIEDTSGYIYIGDAWELDIVSSIRAGWQAIYVYTVTHQESNTVKPLFTCNSLEKCKHFLQHHILVEK